MSQDRIDPLASDPSAAAARWQQRAGRFLLLAALLLYGATLDNGLQPEELVGGDLITHQYAQVQARPSNAPGYPLYTMGGWLWFHSGHALLSQLGNPLPNPIPILSSYSTLWALLALWLLYALLCRLTRSAHWPHGQWPLALGLTFFYATTYFFWYYATTTEQYSSAIAQTLAILYLYLVWREGATTNLASGRLYALACLCGLSLAHMLTVAFIVPGVVAAVLWQAPTLLRRGRVVSYAILAAFAPLLSYLYVYWRGATHPEWWGEGPWRTGTEWFWAFVSTAQGREELGWGFSPTCGPFANGFPALIGQELTWFLVIIGLIGIARLDRRLATLLYSTLLIYVGFAWAYRCGNWFQVILPAYALLLFGVAALSHSLWQWVAQRGTTQQARYLQGGMLLLFVGLAGWNGVRHWSAADSRNRPEDQALDQAAQQLAQPLPHGAYLFATVEDTLALQYLTTIWGLRPDLRTVSSRAANAHLRAGEAVYSTWEAAATLRNEVPAALVNQVSAVDPLWLRLAPNVLEQNKLPITPLNQVITSTITLVGYTFTAAPSSPLAAYRAPIAEASNGVELTLLWAVGEGGWPPELAISVRPTWQGALIAQESGGYYQQDRPQPANGLTQGEGTQHLDPYQFVGPTPGLARVDGAQVVLYRQQAGGFENLAVLTLPRP